MSTWNEEKQEYCCECGCGTVIDSWNSWVRGHCMRTAEARARMTKMGSTRIHSWEEREEASKRQTGVSLSPEHVEAMRIGMLEAYSNDPTYSERVSKGVLDAFQRDPTYKERIAEAARNRVYTVEEKERWANVNVGRTREIWECENISKGLTEYYNTHPEMKVQISLASKENFKDQDFCARWVKSHRNKQTGLEKELSRFLEEDFPGLFQYTGDGKVWLSGRNPDFICESHKLIIEVFGEHWHKDKGEEIRVNHYSNLGYKCFVEWASSLTDIAIDYCSVKDWVLSNLKERYVV